MEGNFIGTDATGTNVIPNGGSGIASNGSGTIGGTVAGAGNIIAGNSSSGLSLSGSNLVEGNYIGTDATGTKALINGADGIDISGNFNTIGGTTAAARNVISGSLGDGIDISGFYNEGIYGSNSLVEGNFIGTDVTGTVALPNAGYGISIKTSPSDTIGGTAAGAGNVIAYNGKSGVGIEANTSPFGSYLDFGDSISGNSIYANGGLGIDLGDDGVTPNNPAGSVDGPNQLQPYPVLSSATPTASGTLISATLDAAASTAYTVEFFANLVADPSGYGQGQTYIGSEVVTTDATGHAAFIFNAPLSVTGQYISATATDPMGNTSEFAQDVFAQFSTTTQLVVSPGPVYIGLPFTLTATVGGVPGAGIPAGIVHFSEDGLPIGIAVLDSSGSGSLPILAQAGIHLYAATFVGSTTYAESESNVIVTAVKQTTTTILLPPPSPPMIGLPFTLTAVVTSAEGVTPTGAVDFSEDGLPIGSAILNVTGSASLSIPAFDGSHSFAATFVGSPTDTGSTSETVVVTAVK